MTEILDILLKWLMLPLSSDYFFNVLLPLFLGCIMFKWIWSAIGLYRNEKD